MNVNDGARLPLVPADNQAEVRQVSSTQGQTWPGHVAQVHTPPPVSSNPLPVNPQWPSEEFDPDYVSPEGSGWASRFPQGRSVASPDTWPSLSRQHRLPQDTAEGAMQAGRQRDVQTPPHRAQTVTADSPPRADSSSRNSVIVDYARTHPGQTGTQIATRFGVRSTTVNYIRRLLGLQRPVGRPATVSEATRFEIANDTKVHSNESGQQIGSRFGVSQTTVKDIPRDFGSPGTSDANSVRPAVGSFRSSRSLQADPGNLHVQRFLQQLQSLPARPAVMPGGDSWNSLPVEIRLDVYGNDRLQFDREVTQAATERDRIDWTLAQSGLRVVRNDGDHSNCLLISLLQHATGDYSRNHLARADAIRNQLFAERLIRLNEPMLFTGPETRRALEIVNGNSAVTPALRVYSISDVAGTIAVDRIASPYRSSRDVVIWDQGGHFEAIARQ